MEKMWNLVISFPGNVAFGGKYLHFFSLGLTFLSFIYEMHSCVVSTLAFSVLPRSTNMVPDNIRAAPNGPAYFSDFLAINTHGPVWGHTYSTATEDRKID